MSTHLRWWRWWLLDRAVVTTTWLMLRVLPARPVAVVHGWPDWEGNAVEVIRGLARHYPGTVYWLRNSAAASDDAVSSSMTDGKVVTVKVNSLRAIVVSWLAETTFFTHGLVTAVRPPRSRLVVNLWHGDGPKHAPSLPRCRSTVAVAATRIWGLEKARLFGLSVKDVAMVGNPRIDSVMNRSPYDTRRLLEVPEDGRRLVIWLPTYRRGWDGRHDVFHNGDPLSTRMRERITVPAGVRLLVKPHPLDMDDYAGMGARVITDVELSAAGLTLQQVLAASDALLSDASSAWVDYLTFNRPIGFFLPDLDQYGDLRGYNVPDLHAVLPGPVLPDITSVNHFLQEVRDGVAAAPSATEALGVIGYSARLPVTEHLFAWLNDYQRSRKAKPLFVL